VNYLKSNFKICIKIDIKTALTCFGIVKISLGSALFLLAKATLPDGGTTMKHVGAVLMSILVQILKLFLRQFTCASVGE
jgi:hypothetical protein